MDRAGFEGWMDVYGRAFEGRDADLALRLFSPHATYQWGPFGDLLHGPQEIRDCWAIATGDPDETDFRFDYEILAVTEEIGIARWMASAARPAQGRRLHYDGVFAVALGADGLCDEFREWWNTRETPLDGTPGET
jgi:hypothetical protein